MRTRRGCRRSSRKRRRWDEADFCTVPCPGAAGRMRARPQRPFLRRAGLLPNGAGAARAHVRRRCAGHCAVERLRNGKQRRRRLLRTGCAGRERRRAGRPYPARIHAFAYGLRYADAGAAVQRAGLRPQRRRVPGVHRGKQCSGCGHWRERLPDGLLCMGRGLYKTQPHRRPRLISTWWTLPAPGAKG